MWTLHRWVWQLNSPLFVGMPPAGSLNRCRLYIPARALWAAITAELARRGASHFPSYAEVGRQMRENARFTYLYPAKREGDSWRAWLPSFQPGIGLAWQREDRQACEQVKCSTSDLKFRRRFLESRPGTAINPDSDSAEDKSLRETECVLPYWRQSHSQFCSPVGFVGYVFLKEGFQGLSDIATLFLGGDTRYGLGQLQRAEWVAASNLFGCYIDLQQNSPIIRSDRLLAHTTQDGSGLEIIGAQECLAGWDLTLSARFTLLAEKPLWMPGSRVRGTDLQDWQICEDGFWKKSNGSPADRNPK